MQGPYIVIRLYGSRRQYKNIMFGGLSIVTMLAVQETHVVIGSMTATSSEEPNLMFCD